MTQILVTLNEDATTLKVRKAIELLRGVMSTTLFKTRDEANKKTLRQQTYVKESLERAFDEMKQARREGRQLQSADDFIKELQAEEPVGKRNVPAEFKKLRGMVNITDEEIAQDKHLAHIMER